MLGELLSALGVGGSLMTALMIGLIALYIRHAMHAGAVVGTAASAAGVYAVVVLVALAVATALGWIDPRPSRVLEHAAVAWEWATGPIAEAAAEWWDWISGVGSVETLNS